MSPLRCFIAFSMSWGMAKVLKKSEPLPDGRQPTIGLLNPSFSNTSIKELIVPSPPMAQ